MFSRVRHGVLSSIACVLAAAPLWGAGVLTMDEAVAEALRANPELSSLRARAAALDDRSDQETVLPNPSVTFGTMNPSEHIRLIDGEETRVTVAQELPGFGKRELRGRLAARSAALVWVDLRIRENETALQVREAAYDLAATQASLALLRQEQAVLERIVETARTRLTVGTVKSMDVIRAQSEVIALKQRQLEWERREKGLQARLSQWLNRPLQDPVTAVTAPPKPLPAPDPRSLDQLAVNTRPELEAARVRVEQAGLGVELAARNGWPDFMISAEKRNYSTGGDQVMLMAGLTLPLWRSGIRAGIREAEHTRDAEAAALEAARREMIFEIEDACYALDNANRALALSRESLVPQAQQQFASAEASYRTGSIGFADLLESERFLLETRLMEAQTTADAGKAAARLERVLGGPVKAGQVTP